MKREILATAVLSGALLSGLSGDTAPSSEPKDSGKADVGCTMLSMSAEGGRLTAQMVVEGFDPRHVDVALAGLWFSISSPDQLYHIDEKPQVSVRPDGGVVVATAMSNLQDPNGEPVNGQAVSSGFVQLNPNASQPYNGIGCDQYSVVTFSNSAPVSAVPY